MVEGGRAGKLKQRMARRGDVKCDRVEKQGVAGESEAKSGSLEGRNEKRGVGHEVEGKKERDAWWKESLTIMLSFTCRSNCKEKCLTGKTATRRTVTQSPEA